MGLLSKLSQIRMKDPVEGTARVAAVDFPHGVQYQDAQRYMRLNCVVSGPGIEPVAIEHTCTAPTSKVPGPNTDLPVLVDRADPNRIQIQWDKVGGPAPTAREQRQSNRKLAQDIASGMQRGNELAEPHSAKAHSASLRTFQELKATSGLDDVGQSGTASVPSPSSDDDMGQASVEQRLAQLEHLHARGVLSADELAAQRQRILDSI
jgi:hypothetical protein